MSYICIMQLLRVKVKVSYSPLVRALLTLDSKEKACLMRNFDIPYVLACEVIAFMITGTKSWN